MKRDLTHQFFVKGVTVAVLSGMFYGLYSAFLYWATSQGVWVDWYTDYTAILPLILIGALASAINDSISAVWCWIIAIFKGKAMDVLRSIKTKPGLVMIVCALVGGPISSTCYVVAFKMAGSMAIPISALCPAVGAIIGAVLFKQKLNGKQILGILICIAAVFMIGSYAFTGVEINMPMVVGMLLAFVAAIGWGIEGAVAGYGTTLIDYEIGITIRQTTSGVANLAILVPIVSFIYGDTTLSHMTQAFGTSQAMMWFVVSGFFAVFAYSLWYKGNSMCGAALGMACNGAFSFWGPFFTWIVVGLVFGMPDMGLLPLQWVGAIVMFIGICFIAELIGKKKTTAEEVAA
jgi:drug/metabolite transporter (DMT)-like permease